MSASEMECCICLPASQMSGSVQGFQSFLFSFRSYKCVWGEKDSFMITLYFYHAISCHLYVSWSGPFVASSLRKRVHQYRARKRVGGVAESVAKLGMYCVHHWCHCPLLKHTYLIMQLMTFLTLVISRRNGASLTTQCSVHAISPPSSFGTVTLALLVYTINLHITINVGFLRASCVFQAVIRSHCLSSIGPLCLDFSMQFPFLAYYA